MCKSVFVAFGECASRERKFCSLQCYRKSQNTSITLQCQECEKLFVVRGKYKNRIFCSGLCFTKNRLKCSNTTEDRCKNCSMVFRRYEYEQDKGKHLFCSRLCMGKYAQKLCIDNHDFFENINTKEKAYCLGLIASDGSVSDKNKINLTMNDLDAIIFFAKSVGYKNKISATNHQNKRHKTSYSVNITSSQMSDDIKILGIMPRKSFNPEALPPTIPNELEKYFWAGFIDGDGSIYIKKHKSGDYVRLSVVCKSKPYLDHLSLFLAKHGITSCITKDKNIWSISFGGKRSANCIYELFYRDEFGMERKRCKLRKYVDGIQTMTKKSLT